MENAKSVKNNDSTAAPAAPRAPTIFLAFRKKRGRPPKWRKSLPQEIVAWFRAQTEYPQFEAYAEYIDVGAPTLYRWANEHPDLRESMDRCNAIQRKVLNEKALTNKYNANYARFVGINIGMVGENSILRTQNQTNMAVSGGLSINWVGSDSTSQR